jgi:hypothetical protein
MQLIPKGQFTPLQQITIPGIIAAFVNLLLIYASIAFVFSILGAGFKFMLSGGDKEKMRTAGRQLFNAFVGIVLVFSTWGIMGLVNNFFGINLLYFEIPTL